uniref:Cytochrome b6-f complex subunit 7 n=1 Tax=Bangiopsis subsimplex TaxID=139980 RepID=A0A1Y9TL82_9RHOD|nr:cytochrome b6f complex subunit 7 [Bangiopsis subsimplex]
MGQEIITAAEISFAATLVGLVLGFLLLKVQGE